MTVLAARMVDATHLELAEPIDLPPGRRLVVSVLEAAELVDDRKEWLAASGETLRAAYSDSELEYSLDLIKEPNPEYGV